MASWVIISFVIIFAIIFMVFVAPNIFPHDTAQKQSLQQFCAQFKLQSRQHIFQGIEQCYQTTKNGASVVDTACDVQETAGQFSFKGDCSLVPKPPASKVPTEQIP
jgi:hypothetical protein